MKRMMEQTDVVRLETAAENNQKALKRFNRLYVFVPLGLTALLAVVVMAAVIASTIFNENATAQGTTSGLADLLVIAFILFPVMLLMVALVGLVMYMLNERRRRGSFVRGRVTKAGTKLIEYGDIAQTKTEAAQTRIADTVIKTNSRVTKTKALLTNIAQTTQDTIKDIV